MSFEKMQLAAPILKAVNLCGYSAPTPIQTEAIPQALAGKDLIGSAQTGTGKTAAFVLPALQRLSMPSTAAGKSKGPRVLVLTPTRELANQVTEAVRIYGKFMRIRSGVILGGMPYFEQQRLLSQPVDLIVATPASRQTLLFTATWDNSMAKLAQRILKDPVRVEITGKKTTLEAIEQRLHAADDMQHKNRLLNHLVADSAMTRAIIFSGTKRNADQLARELSAQGHAAAALHGDMNQNARNRTIMNMRRGRVRLLVATDVAARGLDVTGITHVINYDLPKNAEDYVHRIGRTGRAGASGIAISFASSKEVDSLHQIERYIGQTIPQQVIPGLEPARPLRRANSGASRPGAASGKRWQAASPARRSGQNAPAKNSFFSRTGKKTTSDYRFSKDEKRSVKSDGGRFSEFRSARTTGRQSRWA